MISEAQRRQSIQSPFASDKTSAESWSSLYLCEWGVPWDRRRSLSNPQGGARRGMVTSSSRRCPLQKAGRGERPRRGSGGETYRSRWHLPTLGATCGTHGGPTGSRAQSVGSSGRANPGQNGKENSCLSGLSPHSWDPMMTLDVPQSHHLYFQNRSQPPLPPTSTAPALVHAPRTT